MQGHENTNAPSLLADRTRLMIMTTLARENDTITFVDLLARLSLTKGNLSVHARKLEEAGLIEVDKRFVDRKPVTSYQCTEKGVTELKDYLESIERLLTEALGKKGKV